MNWRLPPIIDVYPSFDALEAVVSVARSAKSKAIRRFGTAIASAALINLSRAFRDQKLQHGGAFFGALVEILSKPGPDFDPDRLLGALSARKADEWGQHVTGILAGPAREVALRNAIMAAYEKVPAKAKKK